MCDVHIYNMRTFIYVRMNAFVFGGAHHISIYISIMRIKKPKRAFTEASNKKAHAPHKRMKNIPYIQ